MKKRKSTVLSVLIGLPIILLALYYIVPIFISMGFYQEGVRYKNIDVYEGLFDCFAGTYYWDREEMTVTIPDKYHGDVFIGLGHPQGIVHQPEAGTRTVSAYLAVVREAVSYTHLLTACSRARF